MKKIVISLIATLAMIGCSTTDKVYNTAKDVYTTSKTVVKAVGTKSKTLKAIDTVATKYDDTREIIRGD